MDKFKHKKSLGQNFLKTESILDIIVNGGDLTDGDCVLEIGPGEGALTDKLLSEIKTLKGSNLLIIEKDHRLIPVLNEKFSQETSSGVVEILEKDILKWSSDEYFEKRSAKGYKLIANIPYYITGAILEKFLSAKYKPSIIIVMVQKEVADRVVSRDGKQNILGLCTKFYGDSEILKIVKPGNFNPPPKVDSAVLKITLRNDVTRVTDTNFEKTYLQIIKKGLAHKRKKLSSNLRDVDENYNWPELFTRLGIDTNARGEDLPFEMWMKMTEEYLKG